MKKITVLFAAAMLFSCTKEINQPETKPDSVAFATAPALTFMEMYYRIDYENKFSVLIKQTAGLNTSIYTFYDTTRKYTFLIVTFSTVTNKMLTVVEPPLPVDQSYRKCMAGYIKECYRYNICKGGLCSGGAMLACLLGWSIDCMFSVYRMIIKFPKITKVYLGPLITFDFHLLKQQYV